ncbi:TetR/AcrR family transcriptional regulator [Seongchinamella unica]|uniref:TetR/AcrR family transcriptional regulator n=1 Tax=Seongchinamella unica TaxID=2547392 RepID=A0A4R5LVC4_9GAMM|nr:TetR/AcrR family transcriptional regulator [Seongchinamella unica]TDG15342.1 TetR/AcrR family transcriptional regulator [Seongchinamella unica]
MNDTKGGSRAEGRMTQAERTALSDRRMFKAAIELINERGTQKTTLKEIGERAGYSRGLANYRFGSKDGLMMELFEQFDSVWKEHLENYVAGRQGLDALQQAACALRDFLKKESSYMRAMYLLWYECLGHDTEMRRALAQHHDVYRADARRWIEQGIASGAVRPEVDAAQAATHYCAFVFGIVYQWLVNAEALDLDAVFDSYIDSTIANLANPNQFEETADE